MTKEPKYSFAVVKHVGDLNTAVTVDGHTVHRQEDIFIPEWGKMVKCASYDDHFIYEDPLSLTKVGRWGHMCTCGSPAVIVGLSGYKGEAEGPEPMLVCYIHASTKQHTTGGRRWI